MVALAALVLAGCKSQSVVGRWNGALASSADSKNLGSQFAQKAMGQVSLDLKSDHTFNLKMLFPFEGTWEQSGSTVSLKVTKMMGQSVDDLKKVAAAGGQETSGLDKSMVLSLSPDGRTLADKSGTKGAMVFTRAAN